MKAHFPKEYEFKKNYENCEHFLEKRLLGWSYKGTNNISSPWNIPNFVDEYLKSLGPIPTFLCQQPEEGDPKIVLAMHKIRSYYGSMYVKFKNMWFEKYHVKKNQDY